MGKISERYFYDSIKFKFLKFNIFQYGILKCKISKIFPYYAHC